MRTVSILFLMPLLALAGCAQSHPDGYADHSWLRIARAPGYFVPTAAMVQSPYSQTAPPRSTADQALPASDADYFFPRGEKTAFGGTTIAGYSAYSTYTYDAQAIGIRHSGYGTQYRWIFQTGLSAPPQ